MKCNVYAYDLVLINNNVRSGDFSVDRKNQLISPVTGVYVVFQLCGEKPKIRPYILDFKKILQFFFKVKLNKCVPHARFVIVSHFVRF